MVVHAYNPSYLGGRGRRIVLQGCLGKSVILYQEKEKTNKN
jgi:hypothetical protein